MTFHQYHWDELGVTAEISAFIPDNGVAEFHLMLHVAPHREQFEGQLRRLYLATEQISNFPLLRDTEVVMKRYFLSDATNQHPLMREERDCAVSFIQQPPLDGSKVALWVYLQRGTTLRQEAGVTLVEHNGYRHLWQMGLSDSRGDSAEQTTTVLTDYERTLAHFNATLADHCVRTWFFVRDVDTQYAGMVRARLDNFEQQGLTKETHYISSTGIGGLPADPHALIQLGTYALTGFQPEQQRYLYALTHLNPTIEYGVTFERGTLLEFGDRAHAYISGTASIDNKGAVVHVGDIVRQTQRMWENVEALLAEGAMNITDHVMQIIVYLRDTADYKTVRDLFAERYPNIPIVITLAPVCRPEWLIEMERIAIAPRTNENYRAF